MCSRWAGRVLTGEAYIQLQIWISQVRILSSLREAWSSGLRRQNLNTPLHELARPARLCLLPRLLLRFSSPCARLPDWRSRTRPHRGSLHSPVNLDVAGSNPVTPTSPGCSSMAEHQTNRASRTCADDSLRRVSSNCVRRESCHALRPHNGCVQTGLQNPHWLLTSFPKGMLHYLRPELVRGMACE